MEKVKIIIVDDHNLIHEGINNILSNSGKYLVIGHAYNGFEAIKMVSNHKPDVIFMDISMPELNGIETTKRIINDNPQIKVIALSQHEEIEYVDKFLDAGGVGFLIKNSNNENFGSAIDTVMNGKLYFADEISEKLIANSIAKRNRSQEPKNVHLTQREIEIIKKIAEGKSNNEIADDLFISVRTVETHRRNLMQKLKVNSVVALLKYATSKNLVNL